MEKLGRWIQPVGPHNRARFNIYTDLAEVGKILELLTKRPVQQERAIDLAHDAVAKAHPQAVILKRFDIGHTKHC